MMSTVNNPIFFMFPPRPISGSDATGFYPAADIARYEPVTSPFLENTATSAV
jgi:hypothetical protein